MYSIKILHNKLHFFIIKNEKETNVLNGVYCCANKQKKLFKTVRTVEKDNP